MLTLEGEEYTCPYPANVLVLCESVQSYRHRVLQGAHFAAAKVLPQQPRPFGKNYVLSFRKHGLGGTCKKKGRKKCCYHAATP